MDRVLYVRCDVHRTETPIKLGPNPGEYKQIPPPSAMCIDCLQAAREVEPEREVREVRDPRFVPIEDLPERQYRAWQKRIDEATQRGHPQPGSVEEYNAIRAMDDARDEAVAFDHMSRAERRRKAQGVHRRYEPHPVRSDEQWVMI